MAELVALGDGLTEADAEADADGDVEALTPGVVAGVAVGVAVGGSGGVGQFASAGLKTVGDGVGIGVAGVPADAVGAGPEVTLRVGVGLGVGVGVGDAVGVSTYGVYEGHWASCGLAGACCPATMSEMATATAPTSTVATKVKAPHSRRSTFMPATPPSPSARRH